MGKGILVICVVAVSMAFLIIIAVLSLDYARQKAEEKQVQRIVEEAFEELADELEEAYEELDEGEELVLENQDLNNGVLIIYIRNASIKDSVLDAIYVDGSLVVQDNGSLLRGNSVTALNLTEITGLTFWVGQEITLVTEEGTQIKFAVR